MPGQQQDVHRVEPRHEVVAGELAAEQEHRQVRADDRRGQDRALDEADTGAGQQVVRQRVAGEARRTCPRNSSVQPNSQLISRGLRNAPVKKTRIMCTIMRGDEDQRGPVVDLPDQQTAADLEADVHRRGVRLGHPHALQRRVRAVVDDLVHARVEEQRQIHTREDEDREAVEADLAQHEGPVVREDLAQVGLGQLVQAEPAVGPLRDPLTGVGAGPRRVGVSVVVLIRAPRRPDRRAPRSRRARSRLPSPLTLIRSCGSG